jgi:hypothetical protein
MKQNTITALKSIIKKTVTKEVARQMKIVIDEITKPKTSEVSTADYYTGPEPENQQLAKDPVLNKILNETKGGIQGDTGTEPYPTMGGSAYTSDRMTEVAGSTPAGQPIGDMPDFMKKAMSGHSAKVVKAIEKKHGSR